MQLFKCAIFCRKAQKELKDQISGLEDQLRIIEEEQGCPVDLESYINKLNSAKKRIIVVNNILQSAQVLVGFFLTIVEALFLP